MSGFEYDVALSFAGEDRNFARPLALALEDANYSVFYDEFETAELWGTELSVALADIYGKKSGFCLMTLSDYYASKPWPNHERRFAIQNALQTRTDYILPIRLDDAEPGWPSTIAYVDARNHRLSEIVDLALAKFGAPDASPRVRAAIEDRGVAEEILRACFRRALFTTRDRGRAVRRAGAARAHSAAEQSARKSGRLQGWEGWSPRLAAS